MNFMTFQRRTSEAKSQATFHECQSDLVTPARDWKLRDKPGNIPGSHLDQGPVKMLLECKDIERVPDDVPTDI